jgi:hypothetical protein
MKIKILVGAFAVTTICVTNARAQEGLPDETEVSPRPSAPSTAIVPPPPPPLRDAPIEPSVVPAEAQERHDAAISRERVAFGEEKSAPGARVVGIDALDNPFADKRGLNFALHGYFRAPLRLTWARRNDGSAKAGEGNYNYRTPWLVDDDYYRSGFQYTHIQETDFTELYMMVGNDQITGTVSLQGSLYSDAARPLIDRQLGIAQGWVTMRWFADIFGQKLHVRVKGGAFWDRFGWLQKYDTYMFGRTHQAGLQVRLVLEGDDYRVTALHGIGTHLDAIDANQGLTLLNYFHLGASYRERFEAGFYYLDSWTADKRQLKELTDANMSVTGLDARVHGGPFGDLYAAYSQVHAEQATFLAPAIEVLHSYGGRGLTENYLGTQKSDNGTGGLSSFAYQYNLSLAAIFRSFAPSAVSVLNGGDATLSVFGLYTYTRSNQASPDPQVNKDGRKSFKWGAEAAYFPIAWVGASVRFDRVIPEFDDNASAFRILSPRLTLKRTFDFGEGQIYLQYSRYIYGDRVRLRPGQVALENTPDDNVVKVQAQITF